MKIELIKEVQMVKNKGKYEEKVIKKDTYYSPRPRGSAFQRMLAVNNALEDMGENMSEKEYLLVADFISLVFGNQFSAQEFLDGTYSEDIFPTYQKVCQEIANRLGSKMNKIAKK